MTTLLIITSLTLSLALTFAIKLARSLYQSSMEKDALIQEMAWERNHFQALAERAQSEMDALCKTPDESDPRNHVGTIH